MSVPRYISCARRDNIHESIAVMRYGGLVRMIAPDCADMTPADAAELANVLRDVAVECGWNDPEVDDGK